jgi:tRNA (guanine-N7-)-methyltransferase
VDSLIHRPPNLIDRLEWTDLFQTQRPIELELGSGDGSFLAQWAQENPTTNFLGVERLLGRLKKLERKGRRMGLSNLRLMRFEAAYLIQHLIPPHSLHALHVYFPDPWPKRRHRDRRLINDRFKQCASQILIPSGVVWLRTDDTDYFEQMTTVFGADRRFEAVATPETLAKVTTDFEREFNARGIPTHRAAYRVGHDTTGG